MHGHVSTVDVIANLSSIYFCLQWTYRVYHTWIVSVIITWRFEGIKPLSEWAKEVSMDGGGSFLHFSEVIKSLWVAGIVGFINHSYTKAVFICFNAVCVIGLGVRRLQRDGRLYKGSFYASSWLNTSGSSQYVHLCLGLWFADLRTGFDRHKMLRIDHHR